MKKLIVFPLILFAFIVNAQDKKIDKIKSLYNEGSFEKCIIEAEKYIEKNTNSTDVFIVLGFSQFNVYKKTKDEKELRNAVKSIEKVIKLDKEKNILLQYKETKEFHDTITFLANKLYQTKKEKSKLYYSSLVKIYNDTTTQYREFYMPTVKKVDAEIVGLMEKGLLNQTDENGLKQGPWRKVYANGNTAYEIYFKNNKPVGTYKRYYELGQIQVIMNYNENGEYASAQVFDEKGFLSAEGFYAGKEKDSLWTYYDSKKQIIKMESYKNGKLNGFERAYYNNGQIYDEKEWNNGVENGYWKQFFANGNKMTVIKVTEGKRQGTFQKYFDSGRIQVKGKYVNDLPEGEWEFYATEKSTKEVIKYKNGVAENQKAIDIKESNAYKQQLEISKRLVDPQQFMSNPEEYNKIINNK